MPRLTAAERDAFLGTDGVLMRIATVDADGAPHVTPAWYVHEDDSIVFTPRADAVWFANLRREPRVALCIDEDPLPYRKVTVRGPARVLYEPGADPVWRDTYRRIARRYVGSDEAVEGYLDRTADQPRGLVAVPLGGAEVRGWRMPVEGEPDTGMWHQRYYAPGSELARDAASPASPA